LKEALVLQLAIIAVPAYTANSIPVLAAKILKKRTPIDMGKTFIDGRRILGDGKSVEGFIAGVVAGTATFFPAKLVVTTFYSQYLKSVVLSLQLFFVTAFGALLGDILGSFVKRRLGMPRGHPFPVVDQLGFMVTALLLDYLIFSINIFSIETLLLLMLTYIIHKLSNYLAFKTGLKNVPW